MVAAQLLLDVREFGRRVRALGAALDPAAVPEFVQLWRTVAPEDQADAIVLDA
jgi:hypothetical protein